MNKFLPSKYSNYLEGRNVALNKHLKRSCTCDIYRVSENKMEKRHKKANIGLCCVNAKLFFYGGQRKG